ncbi:cation/H(+) antiporter [Micromonospora echinofusca]|uniref:Cation/H(+) antiporter n=1 Tax=Micromonospora echinofusca TaxID=47858 RepID=A0ABS3VN93_MICEH|nr:cation/H(+) antiporter [Micromonospora echinofusca]
MQTHPSPLRVIAVYAALVVVPVLGAVALLSADIGGGHLAVVADAGHATHHPLARLLLAVVTVVGACKVAGALVRRIGQPPVIGEIAAGILLGPSVLGAVWPQAQRALVPAEVLPQLNVLAQLGVVLFVFLTGLELNLAALRGRGPLTLVVSHVSIATPFLLGVLLAAAAYDRFAPDGVGYLPFALFLGVSLSVTALPVLARILVDLGMYRTRIGTLVMTCALAGDVTAWILLAMVVAVVGVSSMVGVAVTAALTAVFGAVLFAARPGLTRLLTTTDPRRIRVAVQVVLVGVLLCATVTERIGVHAIFGAFLFGLVLPGDSAVGRRLHDTVGSLTSMLLLPLFFAYSGLRTELVLLGEGGMWLWCGLVLALAVAGKLGGAALAARAMDIDWRQSWQIGALMNCRGLTELVLLNIGLDLGVIGADLFAILTLMAMLTTAAVTPLVMLCSARPAQADPEGAPVQPRVPSGTQEGQVAGGGMDGDHGLDPRPLDQPADGHHRGEADRQPRRQSAPNRPRGAGRQPQPRP